MKYYHRQFSFLLIGAVLIGAVINLIFFYAPEVFSQQFKSIEALYQAGTEAWKYYAYAINFIIFYIMINFCSMTISIDKQKIAWSFLLKVPSKSILLKDIASVSVVKNHWWDGWGVRKISKAWLYNVSGFDAIEVVEASGKVTRLGSTDVKNLARKLNKLCINSNGKGAQHG